MSVTRLIPAETLDQQAQASDPQGSAWVSANAGSGKTHVLVRRVIRLLLAGTDPSKILCLTYTKAAAANMSNRVFRDLGRWASLPDEALRTEIEAVEARSVGADGLRRARQLFARALETPGGLKIQTIHAFCEAILHQFPLEANIAGHFELMDGQMETALVAEARRDLLSGMVAGGDAGLADAFARVLAAGSESGLDRLLKEIVDKRGGLRAFLDTLGDDAGALWREFDLAPDVAEADIAAAIWPDPYFTPGFAAAIVDHANAAGKTTAANFGADLAACAAEPDPLRRLEALCDCFLTRDAESKTLRAKSTRNLAVKGVAEHFPELADEHARLAAALAGAADRVSLVETLRATEAALVVADRLIARYETLKAARGLLDFNDLIDRTVRLLSRTDVGPWVQYKLDRGIDHILVDEAQDTSPAQWTVVRHLAEEFFAGRGARGDLRRTVFAVGDAKQSIYSFQGADPASFRESGLGFQTRIRESGAGFRDVRLRRSFRSTPDLLAAVDLVFAADDARRGVAPPDETIVHSTIREGEPGYVEIWPLVEPQAAEEPEEWTDSISHAAAPAVVLAERIADTLQAWFEAGEIIEGKRLDDGGHRTLRPGDVLVLVRKRDRFVHALSRALKNRRIPVAGADRLSLSGHIAVRDLIALGRISLQPRDDLSLAALLRSPIFDLSEKTLFAIAHGRGPLTLLDALRRAAESDPSLRGAVERLDRWRNEAAFRPVFEFYVGVLARDGVRSAMIARLGPSAGEILDEFLSFCLAVERTGLPGLESFLATLETAAPEIKREMDQNRDEVRIMTVHAAKGLEAPVVFLVDGGSRVVSDGHLPRLVPVDGAGAGWSGRGYLWRSGSVGNGRLAGLNAGLVARAEEEYRRLLYVGMTRAEDRLILCGYRGRNRPPPGIWHALVTEALAPSPFAQTRPHPVAEGESVLRFRQGPEPRASTAATPRAGAAPATIHPPLPPLPADEEAAISLSPSGAAALIDPPTEPIASPRSPVLDPEASPSFAIARGLAIHRLLESLPGMAPEARRAAATAYMDRVASEWPAGEMERALDGVFAVLDEPRFAAVFGAGTRAEVSLAGRVEVGGHDIALNGMIDRLAVSPDRVLVVDYKTNRPPPRDVGEVPQSYVVQLALYRALLSRIYPGREIACALLFTETPSLIELPAALMDAALERLAGA